MGQLPIEKPNYTQVPNWLLDNLTEFNECQMKILLFLTRQTIGWHKDTKTCSLSYLMKSIGYKNRTKVSQDLQYLLQNKYIQRLPKGNTFEYLLGGSIQMVTSFGNHLDTSPSNQMVTQLNKVIKEKKEIKNTANIEILKETKIQEQLQKQFPLINVPYELEKLLDWSASKGVKRLDWIATARNWLRKASDEFRSKNGLIPKTVAPIQQKREETPIHRETTEEEQNRLKAARQRIREKNPNLFYKNANGNTIQS